MARCHTLKRPADVAEYVPLKDLNDVSFEVVMCKVRVGHLVDRRVGPRTASLLDLLDEVFADALSLVPCVCSSRDGPLEVAIAVGDYVITGADAYPKRTAEQRFDVLRWTFTSMEAPPSSPHDHQDREIRVSRHGSFRTIVADDADDRPPQAPSTQLENAADLLIRQRGSHEHWNAPSGIRDSAAIRKAGHPLTAPPPSAPATRLDASPTCYQQ